MMVLMCNNNKLKQRKRNLNKSNRQLMIQKIKLIKLIKKLNKKKEMIIQIKIITIIITRYNNQRNQLKKNKTVMIQM